MNVNSSSGSNSLNSCEVTSKYFTSKGVMDESLSDFQEKKNFISAKDSKKRQKPNTSQAKPKKNIKKIRGQKDIRTVLKKKNELIAYSNDFGKICKLSGIDLDPEQLQLAIALSKSLHESDTKNDQEISSSSTSQDRTTKIRTTLQEYGFVVPEVKITATKSRKLRKHRKNYKLLQTPDAEKLQIISDKYSQVLFHSLNNIKDSNSSENLNKITAELYHIGTNISYQQIKDNNLLYVEDLIEKSPSFVGCLLKDWSEIPGRPVSPVSKKNSFQFDKINFTQEELDTALSGDIKAAQEIVKYISPCEQDNDINKTNEDKTEDKMDCIEIIEPEDAASKTSCKVNNPIEIVDVDNPDLLTVTQHTRSCSPDIFDDEVSEIIDSPNQKEDDRLLVCQEQPSRNITKPCADVLDLTECVNNYSQTAVIKPTPQLSQGNHTIKRRSNDYMDITDCVVGSSQPIRENIIEENIDLTQNSDDNNATITEKDPKGKDIQSMDLTQSSDTNEELPIVEISGNKSMDDTIILNEDAYSGYHNVQNFSLQTEKCEKPLFDNNENLGFSEALHSPNDFSHDKASITIGSEDDSDSHANTSNRKLEERAISPKERVINDSENEISMEMVSAHKKPEKSFNVTLEGSQNSKYSEDNIGKSKTDSFFEEFLHGHSESSSKENSNEILCVDETSNHSKNDNNRTNNNDDIDLTQETDTSEEISRDETERIDSQKILFNSNLGKIDDVSIDYDELFDDIRKSNTSFNSSRSHTANSYTDNVEKPTKSDLISNSSQNSEVFEISDKELDYSIHKSRLDVDNPKLNFDFGGISIMDNLSDLPSFRPSTGNVDRNLNRSMSDSYLPAVDIESSNVYKIETKSCSSFSPTTCHVLPKEDLIAKTPKNGEYIINTVEVTPMLDYEKMTTPERNAELDKYGLKPFKRKRAVQLLTHLYNQTHPIVESLEDLPSPSKRFKPTAHDISPTKRKSPKKSELFKSPKKMKSSDGNCSEAPRDDELTAIEKENDVYDITSDVPEIKDIECCEEDWVFQKREKAKVHSCRVPLHIAFHNYVSVRRRLRECILRYEPVNIDVIHKGLVSDGFRYDPKDLLKFMDRRCITVKTAENNGRNKKHY